MSSFEFADCPTSVPLAPTARAGKTMQAGTLLLTLRNRTARAISGRISLRPDGGSKPGWFAIDGAPPTSPGERTIDLDPNATLSVKVAVSVPPDGAAGDHLFTVRVAAENDPDNDFVDSPSVAFVVTPSDTPAKPPRQKFPWWAVAAAAALVVVLGGVAIGWAMRDRGPSDVRDLMVDVATQKLRQAGYQTTTRYGNPTGKQRNMVIGQSTAVGVKQVDLVLDPGTPPDVRDQMLDAATRSLQQAGYDISSSRFGDRTGKSRNTVTAESTTADGKVDLVLDPGPKSVVGESFEQAKNDLQSEGYSASFVYGGKETPQKVFRAVAGERVDSDKVSLTLDPGPLYLQNIDLNGQDYQKTTENNYEICEQLCARDTRCKAWSYVAPTKECYLKDPVPDYIIHNAVTNTSGIKR